MTVNDFRSASVAAQVKFWDGEHWCIGIMVGSQIVCACCGGVFDVDEVLNDGREIGIEDPIVIYDTWVDISDEIRDEEEDM